MNKRNSYFLLAAILSLLVASACDNNSNNHSWGNPAILDNDAYGSPQITIEKNGNAYAIWEDSTDENVLSAIANRYIRDTGWGNSILIDNNSVHHAYSPRITFDHRGNAIAIWAQTAESQQNDFALYSVWVNHYSPVGGWSSPQLIETDETGRAYSPNIAFDNNGNAIAIWAQSDGSNYNMWANRYTAGTGWGIAELIETDNIGDVSYLSKVDFDNNGNAIAAWSQSDGSNYNIWANRYTAGSGWGFAELIDNNNAGNAIHPDFVVSDEGDAIIVWSQTDNNVYSIWSSHYNAESGWSDPQLIEQDDTDNAYNPHIGVDQNNIVTVVWSQTTVPLVVGGSIWSNRYVPGDGWGIAKPIGNTSSSSIAVSPSIAVNEAGNIIAIWKNYNFNSGAKKKPLSNLLAIPAPSYSVWANNYNINTGWGSAQLIDNGNTGYSASNPQIVIGNDGIAIAIWESNSKIWWNIYD